MRKELHSFESHKGTVRVGQVIQVKTGDYRRQLMDAEVVGLWQVEHVDEDGEKFFETDMEVLTIDDIPFLDPVFEQQIPRMEDVQMKAYQTETALGIDYFCVQCVHDLYQLHCGPEWEEMLEKEKIFQQTEVEEGKVCAQCLLPVGEREKHKEKESND